METKVKNKKPWVKTVLMIVMAFSIPTFFALEAVQSHKFTELEDEVENIEEKQYATIEENKKLISELGLLSSSSRIEKIAVEELGMHQASSDEIVRVHMDSKD